MARQRSGVCRSSVAKKLKSIAEIQFLEFQVFGPGIQSDKFFAQCRAVVQGPLHDMAYKILPLNAGLVTIRCK